ncbi:MAG TPA: TonB family protein [Candidatus Aquilonibacter sp.]|nr:TonB family protein [Candidatus Aquilonibacter sp.]
MAQLPMWGPDPAKSGPSSASDGLWISREELSAEAGPGLGTQSDVAELADKFAAHSGGELSKQISTELALEIVLNEIVEQACLATGATAAAIILQRDGTLVCRATTGGNAPELGVPLNTEKGLSGACVKTQKIQRCDDAQSDPRVDAEACRLLDVRSVMILPLLQEGRLLGIFEAFSSRPQAFGERDQHTLEALAQRTLKSLQRADEPRIPPTPPSPPPTKNAPEEVPFTLLGLGKYHPFDPYQEEISRPPVRQIDGLTLALGAVVFACAVLLSTLIGLHFGRERAALGGARRSRSAVAAPREPNPAQPGIAGSQPGNNTETAGAATTGTQEAVGAAATAVPVGARTAVVPPAGGLQVYENGREVFRMAPSANARQEARGGSVEPASSVETSAVPLSADAVESSLLHRVEPEYPEEARREGIQGPVVLDVRIGKDGAVQNVNVVSGQTILANAATSAVKQWRFRPHYAEGREVEMQTRVTLRFTLPGPQIAN